MDLALVPRQAWPTRAISLGVVALLASGALVWAATATDAMRSPQPRPRTCRTRWPQVLPEGFADNDLLKDTLAIERNGKPVTIYRARKAGVVTGAVFQLAERGYAGDIVGADGRRRRGPHCSACACIKHAETPGLGDKIEVAKSKWITAFDGKSLGDPPPKNGRSRRTAASSTSSPAPPSRRAPWSRRSRAGSTSSPRIARKSWREKS